MIEDTRRVRDSLLFPHRTDQGIEPSPHALENLQVKTVSQKTHRIDLKVRDDIWIARDFLFLS